MLTYIIDDDLISLYLTEHMLRIEKFSADILTFLSAEKALTYLVARLETDAPAVIFLDLNMPVMNGWEFLEALKPYEFELRDRCRIYILTSSLAPADTAKSREYALVTGIIHKPLDEEEIRAIRALMLNEVVR